MSSEFLQTTKFNPGIFLKRISYDLFNSENVMLAFENYFITHLLTDFFLVTEAGICLVTKLDYDYYDDPLSIKNKIRIGKIINKKIIENLSYSFYLEKIKKIQKHLIMWQLEEITLAFSEIYKYLGNRFSGGRSLAHHETIQLYFSQFFELESELKMVAEEIRGEQEFLNEANFIYFKKIIYKIYMILVKLQGGRAFLYDGMVERLWFFASINNIFSGAEKNL